MIATSQEAYEEYQRLSNIEEKNRKNNAGLNLLNAEKFKPDYFILVRKVGEINLVKNEEKVVVDTNLPFADWNYRYENVSVEGFFEQLKKFVQVPKYKFFIQHNRKRDNKLGWYYLPKFREENLVFEEIRIEIGERARHELELLSFDFLERIKFFLAQQKEPSEKEQKDFERYYALLYKVEDLERQHKEKSSGYYSYGSERQDKTFKICLDDMSYNEKLKETEKELKKLCKKYSFLKMPDIKYVKIAEPIYFEDWFKENEADLQENWDSFDDDMKEDWNGDFNSYAQAVFEEFEPEE